MTTPIIYEVNIKGIKTIDEALFLLWLRDHIQEMESLPGFLPKTQLLKVEDDPFQLSVRYFLKDKSAMTAYFEEWAPKMRGQLNSAVKDCLEFSRRVLSEI